VQEVGLLKQKDIFKVNVDPEILSLYILKHILAEDEIRSYAIDRSNLLGFIGEQLTQRYILPKLCSNYGYIVCSTLSARPI